ncbi:MAG: hypothetical protein QOG53_2222 [Frankiales bacterium]|jgi:hypothetical protein|nr:hypothetical protein [Frankiales bacterium]
MPPPVPPTTATQSQPREAALDDELLDSGHPDEPTISESVDDRWQRAGGAAQDALSDGPLAIVAIVLTVVSFLVGQAGTSISYLRIDTVDYAHLINEGVVGTAAVTAFIGLIAAIFALMLGRDLLRTWRKEVAVAAVILGILSSGLHGTLWYLSVQHKPPVQQQGQLGP